MYKEKKFRVRRLEEVAEDLRSAKQYYGSYVQRIFLADGDALVVKTEDLLSILKVIRQLFPRLERVSAYGAPLDVLAKTPEELKLLKEAGLDMIYIGAESGDDEILRDVKKQATAEQIREACLKLKAAGIKSKPFTTEKALEKSQESHIGAVLFERETFTRNGSKKRYRDEEGTLHKRRKIMERATTFGVIIGGYTDNEVEEIFDRFVASLDRGIYIDGNFVPIEIEGADWVDKDDSLLKAQVAVQVMITFNGGVYRDTGFAPLTDVRVTSVEKIT